ncbi:MAG: response regulator transcription factor [Deinococcales bacterium]
MAIGSPLQRGRDAYARRAWTEAFQQLSAARALRPLAPADCWRLAVAAELVGRADVFIEVLDGAHRLAEEAGDLAAAAHCAVWIALRWARSGESARASGWLARARRLLEHHGAPCAGAGYLRLAEAQRALAGGDASAAAVASAEAVSLAERFGDDDLHAFGLYVHGLAHVRQARVTDGMALLDEAMLGIASDERMPIVTGIVYCGVIAACRDVHAYGRAREWTAALTTWCERQPDMVPFAGTCMVHRAEILLLHGAWNEAQTEATLARERCARAGDRREAADALYTLGELHRLRGQLPEAEDAYRQAAHAGRDPQPGLALVRLAQGDRRTARAALGRALQEERSPLRRARLLPAVIEASLASEDAEAARVACEELEHIAEAYEAGALRTVSAQWRGAVELASGDPTAALVALRSAWRGFQAWDAPYPSARTRELIGRACLALGDRDSAALELQAAREGYAALGATADLARLEAHGVADGDLGLTRRERQVLRLVAAGASNKAVAAELGVSERTVERHLSNVFDKLGVSSRTEAAAFAFRHGIA